MITPLLLFLYSAGISTPPVQNPSGLTSARPVSISIQCSNAELGKTRLLWSSCERRGLAKARDLITRFEGKLAHCDGKKNPWRDQRQELRYHLRPPVPNVLEVPRHSPNYFFAYEKYFPQTSSQFPSLVLSKPPVLVWLTRLHETQLHIHTWEFRAQQRQQGAPDSCRLYTAPRPRDVEDSGMPSSA